jgi:GT2 family glycosyltransferase/predicted O-methyltransferase YrrM
MHIVGKPEADGQVAGQEMTEGTLDSQDVSNCFNLFLGRMPASSSLPGLAISNLSTLLHHIFEMDEFKTTVLPSVLLRDELPHSKLQSTPSFRLIDWVQRRLPIDASTRRVAGGVRTWAQLLELLLSDANLVAIAPHLVAADVYSILRQRLQNESWSKLERSVVGAIDAASGFEIRGWAVDVCDKSIPVILEFYVDLLFLGSVSCREFRPDVVEAVGGDGKCGFTFKISASHRANFAGGRTLVAIDSRSRVPIGTSTVVYSDAAQHWDAVSATRHELAQLRQALDRIEARLPDVGRMASIPIEAYDEYWDRFYRLTPEILAEQRIRSRQLTYRPLISVIVPTWKSHTRLLDQAINSVRAQTYDRWELVLTDDASGFDELSLLGRRYAAEPRIRWLEANLRGGIAVNTNRGISAAQGDYIAFLDHDDQLAPDALYHVALSLKERQYGLLYSDEDRIEEDEFGRCVHHTPFFKPGYDPDLLRALNYICHLVVLRRDVVAALGGLRSGFEGAQDHDLLLRAVEHLPASDIQHIPRVLYHWRVTAGSVSRTPKAVEDIQTNIVAAVKDQLRRLNLSARVETHNDPLGSARQFATRVRWCLPTAAPKVSIIVATRDRLDLLRPCLTSVLDSLVSYPGPFELLLVDNDSAEPDTLSYFSSLTAMSQIRLIRFRGPFNWSAINNVAAREARGEVLIFLNNDTHVLSKEWCVEFVANAVREDVGAVGARLLYADGSIQHGGVVLGVNGVAGHESVGETPAQGGYFGRSQLLRSAAAVTGACLATRRDLFEKLDGFDELNLKVAFNDIDYCMKVRKAGYRVVYNPFAVLYHLESKSRGLELSEAQQTRHRTEAAFFRERWGGGEIVDPYYNSHFERFARPFERLRPPPSVSGPTHCDAVPGAQQLTENRSAQVRVKRHGATAPKKKRVEDLESYLRLSETIPGWTRNEEAGALARMAYSLEGNAVIVEIGSFFGSSSVFLAGARKLKGAGKVHCVDLFDGSGDSFSVPHYNAIISAFGGRSPREHFEKNVRAAGLDDWVELHQGDAAAIATDWTTAIDMLILDGDQSPAGVRAAYEGWSPWLKPGGVIALHNSAPRSYQPQHDGHYLVATEQIQPPHYTERHLVGSITFARKTAETVKEKG